MAENGNYYTEQRIDTQAGVAPTWNGGSELINNDDGKPAWMKEAAATMQINNSAKPNLDDVDFQGGRNYAANAGNFFQGQAVKNPKRELNSVDYYISKGWSAENALASQQSNLRRLGNGIMQSGVLAVGTFLGNTAGIVTGLINGTYSALSGNGFVQGFTEQPISKTSQRVREWSQNTLPIYHTKKYDESSVIGRVIHIALWADLMAQAGFTVGAAGSMAAYTALAVEAGLISGGAGTVGMVTTAVIALLSAFGEATQEALSSKQENEQAMYAELTRQYNEMMANASTAQEYSDVANWYASQSAKTKGYLSKQENMQFGLNLAVLGISNATMFCRMASRGAKATSAALAQRNAAKSLAASGSKEAASAMAKARRLQRTADAINKGGKYSVAKDALGSPISVSTRSKGADYAMAGLAVGKTALSEGAEEWSQSVLADVWKRDPSIPDFYAATLEDEGIDKADSMISAYFATMAAAFKDPDAWQEAFMGALTGIVGVPGGGNMSFRQGRLSGTPSWTGGITEAIQEIKEGYERRSNVDIINDMLKNDGFRHQYEAIVGSITDDGLALSAAQAGDKFDFENYRHRSLVRTLIAADKMGLTEQIYGPMADAMSRISEEEVEQMKADGLINYEGTAKDYAEKTKKAGVELKQTIERLLDIKTDLMARHGNNLSDEAMSNIIYGSMQIDNWAKRRSEIGESANEMLDKLVVAENGQLEYDGKVVSLGEEFDKLTKEQKQNYIDNLRFSVKQALWLNGEFESKAKDENGDAIKIDISELRSDLAQIIEGLDVSDSSSQSRKETAQAIRDIDKINDSIKSFSDKIKEYESLPKKANDDVNKVKEDKAKSREAKKKAQTILSAQNTIKGRKGAKEVRQGIEELSTSGLTDDEIAAAIFGSMDDVAVKAYQEIEEKKKSLLKSLENPAAAQVVIALSNQADSVQQLSEMLKQEQTVRKAIDDALNSNASEAIREELSKRDEVIKKLFADYEELASKADKAAEVEHARQKIIDEIAKKVEAELANAKAFAAEQTKVQEQLEKDLEGIKQEEEKAAEEAKREGKLLPAGNDPSPDAESSEQGTVATTATEQSDNAGTITDTDETSGEEYSRLKGTRKPLAFFEWREYKKNSHTKKTIKDNPKFAAVVKYYEEKGIKETVDNGGVSVGDTLSIMVDTKAKDNANQPIIVYVKTYENGDRKVVGIYQAVRNDTAGMALKNEILAKYEKEANADEEFFDTGYKCTIEDITRGKLNYGRRGSRHDIGEIAADEGLTYGSDFSIGFIGAKNGRNTVRYAGGIAFKKTIGNTPSGLTEAKYNGMPVAIIKDGLGGFKFAPIAVERFNAKWYKANQNSSMARKIDAAINRYIAAKGEEWERYADELENLLYLGNQNLRFRLAKKSDGAFYFYEQIKENGEWVTDKTAPIHPFKDAGSMREAIYKLLADGVQFNITERAIETHAEDLLESHCLVGEIESLKSHYVEFGVSEAFAEKPSNNKTNEEAINETEQEEDDAPLEEPSTTEYDDDFRHFFDMEEGPFMEYNENGEQVDVETERAVVQQMLGEVDVEYAERLSSMNGQEKSGVYRNGKILISLHGNRGVTYHEAFHYVMDKLLTEEERQELFAACEGAFTHADGTIVSLSEKKLLEENMAEEFREYVMDRETFIGKVRSAVRDFFRRLYDFLVGMDNMQRNNRERVYRDIMQGAWKAEQSQASSTISEIERDALHTEGLSDGSIEILSEDERQAVLDCMGF